MSPDLRQPALVLHAPPPADEQPPTADYELPPLSLLNDPEPFPVEDHEQKLREVAVLLEKAFLDYGVNVKVVGIHTGPAVLGWIGTVRRLDFTAIGDSVNTAKRIQENSAKNQILISRAAYEHVRGSVEARPYAPLQVKGKRITHSFALRGPALLS